MSARSVMGQRCSIQRQVDVSDQGGGYTSEWQTHLEGVPCRTWFVSGAEDVRGSQMVAAAIQVLIVPLETDVTEADQIREVVDRKGLTLVRGPLRIDAMGVRRDHKELRLSLRNRQQ